MASATGASGTPGASDETRLGVILALAAYGMWGVLPAYFKLLDGVAPDVVVAHRILWSTVFVGGYLALQGRIPEIIGILKTPRLVGLLFASAVLIAANWLIFVWAIGEAKVLDVSLGYFINPLVSILLGLVILREKLTPVQALAVGIATLAVILKAVFSGGLPWVAISLAVSFAFYGYIRKITPVGAAAGLFVEIILLMPFALGYVIFYAPESLDPGYFSSTGQMLALAGTGIITAVPLILFSGAARRLSMVLIGLIQYIAPSLHFLQAVFIWGEPLQMAQLGTFSMIWLALALVSLDSLRRWRQSRAG
ncbi:MAG: EamA family transporter RarD [Pannonibacter sp.]